MEVLELPEYLHRDIVEQVSEASLAMGAVAAMRAAIEDSPEVLGVSLLPICDVAEQVIEQITEVLRAKIAGVK